MNKICRKFIHTTIVINYVMTTLIEVCVFYIICGESRDLKEHLFSYCGSQLIVLRKTGTERTLKETNSTPSITNLGVMAIGWKTRLKMKCDAIENVCLRN